MQRDWTSATKDEVMTEVEGCLRAWAEGKMGAAGTRLRLKRVGCETDLRKATHIVDVLAVRFGEWWEIEI